MDRKPVDRQRGPPTGLGITALTPTPRAVIPGTESQAGSRKRRLSGSEAQDRQGAKKCAPA